MIPFNVQCAESYLITKINLIYLCYTGHVDCKRNNLLPKKKKFILTISQISRMYTVQSQLSSWEYIFHNFPSNYNQVYKYFLLKRVSLH